MKTLEIFLLFYCRFIYLNLFLFLNLILKYICISN